MLCMLEFMNLVDLLTCPCVPGPIVAVTESGPAQADDCKRLRSRGLNYQGSLHFVNLKLQLCDRGQHSFVLAAGCIRQLEGNVYLGGSAMSSLQIFVHWPPDITS